MELFTVILGIIGILSTVAWTWFKLKAAEEGDLIDIGLGTHVEYGWFQLRIAIALIISSFVLLVGLVS